MDTSAVSRATSAPPVPAQRPAPMRSTELAAPQAIRPAVKVDVSQGLSARLLQDEKLFKAAEPKDREPAREPAEEPAEARRLERGFVTPPGENDLVFRVADGSTGSIVMQIPSEEALKMRAYQEQLERQKAERHDAPHEIQAIV